MDISVLASVGSFVVSERVLKPKASVVVVLGCFLAYDLTTKTRDSSSLRVYRGPALMAFTLIMAAFSLRTWRRNGVACDELLFLPGTPHGERHGVDLPSDTAGPNEFVNGNNTRSRSSSTEGRSNSREGRTSGEADVAAGVAVPCFELTGLKGRTPEIPLVFSESSSSRSSDNCRSRTFPSGPDNSMASSSHEYAYSWDEDDEDDGDDFRLVNERLNGIIGRKDEEVPLTSRRDSPSQVEHRAVEGVDTDNNHQSTDDLESGEFREARPRITRIGSFFFFRSSVTNTQSADYAPSGPSVVGAAIDLSIPTLFNFHLYIEAYNHIQSYGSETPAKILPLIFLTVLIFRTFLPPGRRGRFWSVMSYTFMAPFHRVRFRDAFIGDFLTSLVRPLQDILFALSYYFTVIWGSASGNLSLAESGDALESSWVLHNVALPSCALLPLWWKFLQTLRQSYDSGNRWPHLGNALKYLSAAVVILYGMTHHENRRSMLWIVSFALCVLYQIWWDVVMDWELLVILPRSQDESVGVENSFCSPGVAFQANSYFLHLNMVLIQPFNDLMRSLWSKMLRLSQIQLRPRRLYKRQAIYWYILAYNVIFRFTWMLCFIPAYRLSPSGREHVTTFSSDTNSYVGVLLPVAEILRRTFWGLLLLEKETIRMQDRDPSRLTREDSGDVLSVDSSCGKVKPLWTQQPDVVANTRFAACLNECYSEEMIQKLFVLELSAWAGAFVVLGLCATT